MNGNSHKITKMLTFHRTKHELRQIKIEYLADIDLAPNLWSSISSTEIGEMSK